MNFNLEGSVDERLVIPLEDNVLRDIANHVSTAVKENRLIILQSVVNQTSQRLDFSVPVMRFRQVRALSFQDKILEIKYSIVEFGDECSRFEVIGYIPGYSMTILLKPSG
jgi:hypothetical protein